MPDYVVEPTSLALNDRGKAVKGSKILVLGFLTSRMWTTSAKAPALS